MKQEATEVTYIDGTPWTVDKLMTELGIRRKIASNRLYQYRNGNITAEGVFADHYEIPAHRLYGGMKEITRNEWRSKKKALLASALCIAAIMPLSNLQADTGGDDCGINITITENHQIILNKPVTVTVYELPMGYTLPRVITRSNKPVNTVMTWCRSLYQVTATVNGQTLSQNFYGSVPALILNFKGVQ